MAESLSEELELFLASVIEANKPRTEDDLLVLVAHAVLLRNEFKALCVESPANDVEAASVLEGLAMPDGWNRQQDPDCYEFSYMKTDTGHTYILKALIIEDKLYINLLRKGDSELHAAEVQLDITDHVHRKSRPMTVEWLVDFAQLCRSIDRGFFGKVEDSFPKKKQDLKTEEMKQQPLKLEEMTPSPLLVERTPAEPHFPRAPPLTTQQQHIPNASPFAYGNADRLPGHPGMGGMLMDPLRSGGLGLRPPYFPGAPRGSVPPGARFDPFGPLTEFDHSTGSRMPRHSFNPNPDHLRRPGFDDDMFM